MCVAVRLSVCVCVCVRACVRVCVSWCVCYSYNNIQDLLILNDLTNCLRRFNVDNIMLYISAMDHARKLIFSSYVHLPYMNNIFQYLYA